MNFSEWFYAVEADLYHPRQNPSGVRITPPTRRNPDSLAQMHDFALENPGDRNTLAYLGHIVDVLNGYVNRCIAAQRLPQTRTDRANVGVLEPLSDIMRYVATPVYSLSDAIYAIKTGDINVAEKSIRKTIIHMKSVVTGAFMTSIQNMPDGHPFVKALKDISQFYAVIEPRLLAYFKGMGMMKGEWE